MEVFTVTSLFDTISKIFGVELSYWLFVVFIVVPYLLGGLEYLSGKSILRNFIVFRIIFIFAFFVTALTINVDLNYLHHKVISSF